MRVLSRASKAEVEALIAQENAHRGYPKTDPGTQVGGGVFVESITTTSAAEALELEDGSWGLPESAITAPGISRAGIADRPVKERL